MQVSVVQFRPWAPPPITNLAFSSFFPRFVQLGSRFDIHCSCFRLLHRRRSKPSLVYCFCVVRNLLETCVPGDSCDFVRGASGLSKSARCRLSQPMCAAAPQSCGVTLLSKPVSKSV